MQIHKIQLILACTVLCPNLAASAQDWETTLRCRGSAMLKGQTAPNHNFDLYLSPSDRTAKLATSSMGINDVTFSLESTPKTYLLRAPSLVQRFDIVIDRQTGALTGNITDVETRKRLLDLSFNCVKENPEALPPPKF